MKVPGKQLSWLVVVVVETGPSGEWLGARGHFHYWRWRGRARWTGYDFVVITIHTGYLNRPNWLLVGYSVYHRVASQGFPAHNVYDRPAISAPATLRAGRNRFLWMYDDTQQNRESVRTSTNEPWINARSRNSPPLLSISQGMHMKVFSKVYCDRVYFLCAERFETGSDFHPPTQLRMSAPSPQGSGCSG